MFFQAGYGEVLEEASAKPTTKVDFKRVNKDLDDTVKDQEYPSDETLDDKALANKEAQKTPEDTVPPPPTEEPVPDGEEAAAEEEQPAPEVKSKDEVIGDLASLEDMVSDIATEIGMFDDEKGDN
jgi:hypothetical protein